MPKTADNERRGVPLPELLTLDAHNDSIILREVRGDPLDFADADPAYQADLPRMRKGGMGAVFWGRRQQ